MLDEFIITAAIASKVTVACPELYQCDLTVQAKRKLSYFTTSIISFKNETREIMSSK